MGFFRNIKCLFYQKVYCQDTGKEITKEGGYVTSYGYIYCTKFAWNELRRSKGQIVVMSAMAGEVGLPERLAAGRLGGSVLSRILW